MKSKDKFLVFGGEGTLGTFFSTKYKETAVALSHREVDIRNKEQVYKKVKEETPNFLLNAAGFTDVEKCELQKELCWEVNFEGVKNLLEVAQEFRANLIQISSPYAILAENEYGKSKREAEKLIGKKGLVIRTNFYSTDYPIVSDLLSRREVFAFTNVFVNPISLNRLAKEIFLNRRKKGLINIFSFGKLSWYEFALLFCEEFGLSKNLVKRKVYKNNFLRRPKENVVASDIEINLEKDLKEFKRSLE